MATELLCSIPDCGKPARTRGWCNAHYHRWQRHGDPVAGRAANGEARAFLAVAASYSGADCLTWPYARVESGYGRININGRIRVASQVVCEMAHGTRPSDRHEAAHSCGNGHLGCVNQRHLSWKTPAENQGDKITHGTSARGERSNFAKLTEDSVRAIYRDTRTCTAVARDFGVSFVTVSDIRRRRSWSWLDMGDSAS